MLIFACKKIQVDFFLKALASMLTCLVSVKTGTTYQSSITLKASQTLDSNSLYQLLLL